MVKTDFVEHEVGNAEELLGKSARSRLSDRTGRSDS
jgi:hypothetical protein